MKQTIEDMVDALCSPGATKQQRPKRGKRIARMLGFGGGTLGLIKGLFILGVTAALISTMIGSFIVSQTDDIELIGRLSYDLYVDGTPVGAEDFVIDPDVFTGDNLSFGETETFMHSFMSPALNGNFDIFWDQEWQTWLQPGHEADEFFGYTFSVLDADNDPVDFVTVMNGTTVFLNFSHQLDYHFAATSNPLPYNFEMHVVEFVPAPIAVNDVKNVGVGGPYVFDIYVLENDQDFSGNGMNITSTTIGTINPDKQSIHIISSADQDFELTYTIVSQDVPILKTATATCHVHCA